MKKTIRPAIFKWRQTEPELILCAARWCLRYSLSLRDVEELLGERGLEADHTTIWRWVQRYGPDLEERLRRHLKPTNRSWRVDETCVRVKGRWCHLYRAIDSTGATIDFALSGSRHARYGQTPVPQGADESVASTAPGYQYGPSTPPRLGDFRSEAGRNPATPLPPPACPILEQHPGAGSSSDQTTNESVNSTRLGERSKDTRPCT